VEMHGLATVYKCASPGTGLAKCVLGSRILYLSFDLIRLSPIKSPGRLKLENSNRQPHTLDMYPHPFRYSNTTP
jgi:hypothetical protein